MNEEKRRSCAKHIEKNKERYEEAKRRWLAGESLGKIGKDMCYNRHIISECLKYEGYNIKQCGRKYDYNANFFKKIDTEQKAYWLGFLYADGSVSNLSNYSLRISLQAGDADHIEKIRQIICPEAKISRYMARETVTGKEFPAARATFNCKELVENLINLGCYPDKTEIITFPYDKMHPRLYRHFIRGYFDGDGSIHLTKKLRVKPYCMFRLCGASREMMLEIQDVLVNDTKIARNDITKSKRASKCHLYQFQNSARKDIKNLYNYLYKGATVWLPRKREKIEQSLF